MAIGGLLYAVTPRFALSTSEAMLEMCQTLVREHATVRVQSHINENPDEIAAVAECVSLGAGLPRRLRALFARRRAHGARPRRSSDRGGARAIGLQHTSIAHCPASNAALGSGIFPLQRHVDAGVHVALGTDVGGGVGFGMLKEALCAI